MRVLRTLLLAATCLAVPAFGEHAPIQRADRALDGWAVASFTLTDQHGQPFTEKRLRGQWTFVLFGDTTGCAERCRVALAALADLMQRIARADIAKTTQVLFVSLDPRRDKPERLREYLAQFDRRFIGGTGEPAMLQRLVHDVAGETQATATHDDRRAGLLLVGPDATIRAEYLPPFDVRRLTAAYVRLRHGRP